MYLKKIEYCPVSIHLAEKFLQLQVADCSTIILYDVIVIYYCSPNVRLHNPIPKARRTRELAAELTGDRDGSSANRRP